MARITITQTRSQIRRPGDQKRTLKALGLGRIGRKVEHEATPQIRGMVEKVRHLVAVEEAA
jgi:large subunit ribosomal protein L30